MASRSVLLTDPLLPLLPLVAVLPVVVDLRSGNWLPQGRWMANPRKMSVKPMKRRNLSLVRFSTTCGVMMIK